MTSTVLQLQDSFPNAVPRQNVIVLEVIVARHNRRQFFTLDRQLFVLQNDLLLHGCRRWQLGLIATHLNVYVPLSKDVSTYWSYKKIFSQNLFHFLSKKSLCWHGTIVFNRENYRIP